MLFFTKIKSAFDSTAFFIGLYTKAASPPIRNARTIEIPGSDLGPALDNTLPVTRSVTLTETYVPQINRFDQIDGKFGIVASLQTDQSHEVSLFCKALFRCNGKPKSMFIGVQKNILNKTALNNKPRETGSDNVIMCNETTKIDNYNAYVGDDNIVKRRNNGLSGNHSIEFLKKLTTLGISSSLFRYLQ